MRKFEEPIFEVVALEVEDVVTTSDAGFEDVENGGGWG